VAIVPDHTQPWTPEQIKAHGRDEPWHLKLDGDDYVINRAPTLQTFGLWLPIIHSVDCPPFAPGTTDSLEHFDALETRAREAHERVLRSGGRAEVAFCGICISRPGAEGG
jgi:hypothetical protein